MTTEVTMDKITALAKNRGFIFPGSEIYGGLANTWDYGPLGVELKNNIKDAWRRKFVRESEYNVGLDAAILMNPETWVASGHVGGFADPLIDCKACKARFRADKLIEDYLHEQGQMDVQVDGWSNEKLEQFIAENGVKCPECGKSDFTGIRQFNLMFKTFQGVTEESTAEIYLRPETAQGIFVNFMELEFFCKPGTELDWFAYWKNYSADLLRNLGIKEEHMRVRDHDPEELSHYSNATTDIEFLFPFGWGELWGVASRTDFDLMAHQNHSGQDMTYMDPETNEKFVPYCIEPSVGVERMLLAFLVDAYDEEVLTDDKGKEDVRKVLRLHPALAPFKAAVLPLSKKLGAAAEPIYHELQKHFMVDYDTAGSIGKRYRREDEIGTPFCICVDFQTVGDDNTPADGCVTVRDRDTMEQVRIPISEVRSYIEERLEF